LGDPLI